MHFYEHNRMEVYGNRGELEKFMSDVHGEGKSVFCFDKIFDLPDIAIDRVKEPFPGLVIYRSIYSMNRFPESDAALSDEVEYLKYSFGSSYDFDTYQIYDFLTNKYFDLEFKIFIQHVRDQYWYAIELMGGEYKKDIHYYWKRVPWRENSIKLLLYKADRIRDTLQVIEEKITNDEDEILLMELEGM